MTTFTQILYHIVFGTKHHEPTLDLEHHAELCRYIAGLLQSQSDIPYRIGGYTDHLHLLISLHPTRVLADTVKDIKLATSRWIKSNNLFPRFQGWQEGYGAFTVSWDKKSKVEEYIGRQQEHHRQRSFREEFVDMLERAGMRTKSDFWYLEGIVLGRA